MATDNPFEYEAANNIPPEKILDFYIEDFNFSRFVRSTRNLFLVGERGCGKSMTLLYNSHAVQSLKASRDEATPPLDKVGVYIPCNTPLMHRLEYELLDEFRAGLISEHFLSLSILQAISTTLAKIPGLLKAEENSLLRSKYTYFTDIDIPEGSFFAAVAMFAQRTSSVSQRYINQPNTDSFYTDALSFSSCIMPLFDCIKESTLLKDTHFMLMIDDAHLLNKAQIKSLNSWIAYRDHSQFSFKVATSKVDQHKHYTDNGGSVLEGHDFIEIDMEQPYQFESSPFGKFAPTLIARRLSRLSNNPTPEEFFPENLEMASDLQKCDERAREEARQKYGPAATAKQINDYAYKYHRAIYFRERASKANRPPYAGFNTLIYLSTGVVRNLLEPCYWMFDAAVSQSAEEIRAVTLIEPSTQSAIIIQRSQDAWNRLMHKLPSMVQDCSGEQAKCVFQLFDQLAVLFRARLLDPSASEPRATSFTISMLDDSLRSTIFPLLRIARKANFLYQRVGPAKDDAKREPYYTPNRMLWPARGLDPVGQHARASLKAQDVYNAAYHNIPFPYTRGVNQDGRDELQF